MMFLTQYPGVVSAMEACGGSNYFGRELEKLGHEVRITPPIHVKSFVKGNKNGIVLAQSKFILCTAGTV
jgi:transposase